MNSISEQVTIPIFCRDQAADIRNIEAAANKALQNINLLYDEIMTPNADADYEATASCNSSDFASLSIKDKNDCHSLVGVPKLLPKELCGKCQELISLCSACHVNDFSNTFQNYYQPQMNFLQKRSNSYPRIRTFRRNSYPERKVSLHQEQHPVREASCHEGDCREKNSYNIEDVSRNSHYPDIERNSHYPDNERNSHYPDNERNSHYPDNERNSHYSGGFKKNSDNPRKLTSIQKDRDFYQQERKDSYSSESDTHVKYPNFSFKSINENAQYSITVPKPFSLSVENIRRQQAKQEKISKLREEINSQIEKELNVQFSPKPVPKHVHLPLYCEMVEINEKRKRERKEICIKILNEKTKPFNLSACVSKPLLDQSQDDSKTFKAKPIPKNVLSENISQKLKDKEEIRKLLIAQRAEEMLKKSSLPFSAKSIHRSHSLFNVFPTKSNINITKEKITAITERLYSIKCQETIENWNNKILQNDLWDAELINSKKKFPKNSSDTSNKDQKHPKSVLPFHNFPVRMTTATFLREKRIR